MKPTELSKGASTTMVRQHAVKLPKEIVTTVADLIASNIDFDMSVLRLQVVDVGRLFWDKQRINAAADL